MGTALSSRFFFYRKFFLQVLILISFLLWMLFDSFCLPISISVIINICECFSYHLASSLYWLGCGSWGFSKPTSSTSSLSKIRFLVFTVWCFISHLIQIPICVCIFLVYIFLDFLLHNIFWSFYSWITLVGCHQNYYQCWQSNKQL